MLTGPRLLPNRVGRVSEWWYRADGWVTSQAGFYAPTFTLLLACRGSLSSWLPSRVRLRRRRRCSLVLSSSLFLRSRETRVTYGCKACFASNLTPVSLKARSSASFSSSSSSSPPSARACPRPRPCARETSVTYGLRLAFALKPLAPGC